MKRFLAAACLFGASLLALSDAHADDKIFNGFLADCSAVTTTSCTELTSTGYARQPLSFGKPVYGVTRNAVPYSFASTVTGTIAGRAVYDAPTGGNLLVVIPLAAAQAITSPGDRGDVGVLRFTISAMTSYPDSGAYNATYGTAGSTIGTTPDGSNVTNAVTLTVLRGQAYH